MEGGERKVAKNMARVRTEKSYAGISFCFCFVVLVSSDLGFLFIYFNIRF